MDVNGFLAIDLNQALHSPGCPICNIIKIESNRYFRFFLHENVNDFSTRVRLYDSLGFCKRHAWQCQQMELHQYQDGMKHGILYEWLLKTVHPRIQEIKQNLSAIEETKPKFWQLKKPKPEPSPMARIQDCPACVSENQSAELYLEILVKGLANANLRSDYQKGDGLCIPHFLQAVELEIEKEHLLRLCDLQIARITGLVKSLTSYVNKHDYQNHEPYTQEEHNSWVNAVQLMVGNKE